MKKVHLRGREPEERTAHLVFILDRSGSMTGLEGDTIGSFNSMIARQQREPGRAWVTTVLFDDGFQLLHDRVPLEKVRPMTEREYYARGCTALLDAVGKTILGAATGKQADRTMCAITTDGLENASYEFTLKQVKELIRKQTEAGWEFLFLGADIDAVAAAEEIGIPKSRAANYYADADDPFCDIFSIFAREVRSGGPVSEQWRAPLEEEARRREEEP